MILVEVNILEWLLEFLKDTAKLKAGEMVKQLTDQKVYLSLQR